MKHGCLLAALFTLLHSAHAHAQPLQIAVLSDVNGSACQEKYPSTSLQIRDRALAQAKVDHIILTGDAVAGQCPSYKGSGGYAQMVEKMWREFDDEFYGPAYSKKGVSIVMAPGNHDAPYTSSSGPSTYRIENEGFVRYWNSQQAHLQVGPLSRAGLEGKYPYYWAYTKDNVLYVVLQSTRTHSLADETAQKNWLRVVLKSPEAKAARLRIAYAHVPAYAVLDPSVGSKAKELVEKEQVGQKNGFMDILLDNKVELLAVGHSHAPYPAELTRKSDGAKIKVLSMPCGHAARKLYSKSSTAPRGFAVVSVSDDNKITLTVYDGSTGKAIPSSYFPAEIPTGSSKVSYRRN